MSLEATGLRTEYRTNPLGIDVAAPRFSWLVRSDRQNVLQRAWRVLVASSPELLAAEVGDLWDSGWSEGGDPCHIVYGGSLLPSATRAHWTVSVEDDAGERSPWAEPAWWETGLLDPAEWQHGWMAAPGFRVPHMRREFEVPSTVTRARLYVTALGLYRASINGRRVGDDWFTPGWTDYRHRVQVQTYDVTDLVVEGTNAMGLVVADGWYAGRLGWLGERAHYGPFPHVRAQLVVDHADGGRTVTGTDDTWRVWSGGIVDTDFLLGETYDSRRALGRWDEVGYAKRAFLPASHATATDGPGPEVALVASAAEPVRTHEELAPIAVTEPSPGVWILDFGQNLVGWVRLSVSGARGDVVQLRFAEMLRDDGHLYTDNLRSAQAVDSFTLGGGDDGDAGDEQGDTPETWEPMFTFHGFRFVEVTGWPGGGPPPAGALTAVVVHSLLEPAGTFECSHEMVSTLQSNIVWGLRGNFLEVPTDCPQRDERLGWMGDIQVFAATAAFNRDVAAFLTKWMWDVVDGQSADGGFPDVAPKVVDPQDGAPAWGDAGAIVPWRV
ncbi:MAG TPA: family 78 glycoside hydrolase catalytic domain, partial [Acidimicrobiales bacterium]|nr:family 78 glycoside hydrolase catalytic domain [Acidimicrobiales bacterium]